MSVENIVIGPVLADTETFVKTAVFISLGEQPGRVHEVFAWIRMSVPDVT